MALDGQGKKVDVYTTGQHTLTDQEDPVLFSFFFFVLAAWEFGNGVWESDVCALQNRTGQHMLWIRRSGPFVILV
jgi:hypothetical protein